MLKYWNDSSMAINISILITVGDPPENNAPLNIYVNLYLRIEVLMKVFSLNNIEFLNFTFLNYLISQDVYFQCNR